MPHHVRPEPDEKAPVSVFLGGKPYSISPQTSATPTRVRTHDDIEVFCHCRMPELKTTQCQAFPVHLKDNVWSGGHGKIHFLISYSMNGACQYHYRGQDQGETS